MGKKRLLAVLVALLLLAGGGYALFNLATESQASQPSASDLISGAPQEVPVAGMVTMVDIGAHSCVPCRMMAPIIKELSAEYEGRAAIVFIDVWKHPEVAEQFHIQSIPTQIFYDAAGHVKFRHIGFLDKDTIVEHLKRIGVE